MDGVELQESRELEAASRDNGEERSGRKKKRDGRLSGWFWHKQAPKGRKPAEKKNDKEGKSLWWALYQKNMPSIVCIILPHPSCGDGCDGCDGDAWMVIMCLSGEYSSGMWEVHV